MEAKHECSGLDPWFLHSVRGPAIANVPEPKVALEVPNRLIITQAFPCTKHFPRSFAYIPGSKAKFLTHGPVFSGGQEGTR